MISPLWSVTIPSYNAAAYIAETLESVISEGIDKDKMEIVVVDNCSTDNTAEIVEKVGKGRVRLVTNEKNVGPIGNFNKCIEAAKGDLVHMLHADDLIKKGFYTRFETLFNHYSEVNLICCNSELIDGEGVIIRSYAPMSTLDNPSNDVSEMIYGNPMLAPAIVVRKAAYDKLGGFDTSLTYVGDWDMWTRVVFNLKGLFIQDTLAQYRVHNHSDTAVKYATGVSILEYEKIFNKFTAIGLPIKPEKAHARLRSLATEYYKFYYYSNNDVGAQNMLSLYKRHSSSLEVLKLWSYFTVRKFLGGVNRTLFGRIA